MKKKFDAFKYDLLKELGNIGMGNAASSLSMMLMDERVNIHVPEVGVVSLGELPDHMAGPDRIVAGIYVQVGGDMSLHMIFIMPDESARTIARILTGETSEELSEMGMSAILEVGNIITAGYVNAISDLAGMALIPSPPSIAVDLTEAILGTILAGAEVAEDFVILIKTEFETGKSEIEGFLCVIPDSESVDAVYTKMLKGS